MTRTPFSLQITRALAAIEREGRRAEKLLSREAQNAAWVRKRTALAAAELQRRGVDQTKAHFILQSFETALSVYLVASKRGLPVRTATGNIRSKSLVGDILAADILRALESVGLEARQGRNGGLAVALDGIARGVPPDRRRLQRARGVRRGN